MKARPSFKETYARQGDDRLDMTGDSVGRKLVGRSMKMFDSLPFSFSFLLVIALALALPLVGCKSSNAGGAATESACDPLAAKAIALGAVVGVGTDASGTLYADAANGVFVSDGAALIRQHVIGTGQSGSNEFLFTFEAPAADATSARNLLVETQGSTADAMALGPQDSKSFLNQAPAGAMSLTLVDAATLAGMSVVNTPNLIDYLADVANGDVILATVPLNSDSTSTDLGISIFYGPPGAVAQRTVSSFQETLSGNGSLTFLVDGTSYTLAFGILDSPDAGPLGGPFALLGLTPAGGAQMATTLRSPTPTELPSDLSFSCLP
ncbi:MAG TPA: hypothetical protein VIK30_07350 [Polyangia bacterium]